MEHNRRYPLNRQDSGQSSTSDFLLQCDKRKPTRKLVTPNSSLEIVDGDQFEGASGFYDDRATPDGSLRSWSRSSIGSVPPRNDSVMSRRTMTPTKQVSLQAVRRREESSEPFVDHIDVESARLNGGVRKAWDMNDDDVDFSKMTVGDHRQPYKNSHFHGSSSHQVNGLPNGGSQSLNQGGDNKLASQKNDRGDGGNEDDDDDDDDDDDEVDEDKDENEKLKAPTELLMEFIDCLMKKDYPNASKLCKMILLYEPENEEALKFQPLIEEKMALDAEAAEEESSDDEDDDDDDDDDDDSDEDSSSDDDDDTTEDDDNDDDVDESSHPELSAQKPVQDPVKVDPNTNRVWKPAS